MPWGYNRCSSGRMKPEDLQLPNEEKGDLVNGAVFSHVSPSLKSLHWLPVSFWTDFKILLVFKCLNVPGSSYLPDLLRPPELSDLQVLLAYLFPLWQPGLTANVSFQYRSPHSWNNFQGDLKLSESVDIFKCKLNYINSFINLFDF